MQTFYSNGKLLLTGEYVVLNGALALAIPTQYGQSLNIESFSENKIIWKSLDNNGKVWFEDEFRFEKEMLKQSQKFLGQHDNNLSKRLSQILNVAKQLNPNFLEGNKGYSVENKLTFPIDRITSYNVCYTKLLRD